jgi:hypothetical protein
MANILTAAEAGQVLRIDAGDAGMLALLPLIDAHIKRATGHDWAVDATIFPEAKAAARILITLWFENPAMISAGYTPLNSGLSACFLILGAMALQFQEFQGGSGAGAIPLVGARVGDTVSSLTGLIGLSGDQSSKFEAVITVDDQIQQIYTQNLAGKFFRVYLKPLGDL